MFESDNKPVKLNTSMEFDTLIEFDTPMAFDIEDSTSMKVENEDNVRDPLDLLLSL